MSPDPPGDCRLSSHGAALHVPYLCTVLADVCDHLGHPEDGLQALAEALHPGGAAGGTLVGSRTLSAPGRLAPAAAGDTQAEAETWLQRALDVARRQEAKSLELRAATSLARLWQQQGQTPGSP